jgi:hypothetical protein
MGTSPLPTARRASMEFGNRLAFETDAINRALRRNVVLFGSVTAESELVFRWRAGGGGAMGPHFEDRELAINWIAEWLDDDVRERPSSSN